MGMDALLMTNRYLFHPCNENAVPQVVYEQHGTKGKCQVYCNFTVIPRLCVQWDVFLMVNDNWSTVEHPDVM